MPFKMKDVCKSQCKTFKVSLLFGRVGVQARKRNKKQPFIISVSNTVSDWQSLQFLRAFYTAWPYFIAYCFSIIAGKAEKGGKGDIGYAISLLAKEVL